MAEAALAVLVTGGMLVTALNMVGMSARARSVNADLGKGPALAHGLMSEVLQAFYLEPDVSPNLVEGPEIELSTHGPDPAVPKDCGMWDDRYVGQIFQPSLPADAVSWQVTRVMFQAKSVDASNGIASVQLRPLDNANDPSAAVLEEHPMPENTLTASYTWQAFDFSTVTDLPPSDGLAFVIAVQQNDADVCAILTDNGGGSGLALTSNAGANWTVSSNKGIPHFVYGKVTTETSSTNSIGTDDGESTSTRADFDDVDDYDSWTASPPVERDGTVVAGYDGWTRSVAVEYVSALAPGGVATNSDSGAKRITVVVTDPRGTETTVISVRTNTGTYEQEVSATRAYCSWIGMDLQIGEANAALSLGASLANEPVVSN